MTTYHNIALIFPGQGAQYPGMGKDLVRDFPTARRTFEEADDLLQRNLSKVAFEGVKADLTETRNCQPVLYVHSLALYRVMMELYPELEPKSCSGLSLGEYSALTASGRLPFADCLPLVQERADAMHQACEAQKGMMAVVMGLDAGAVESMVQEMALPHDLWTANFNCPGQVVLAGTERGITSAQEEAIRRGARRVLPLQVHGAFHSGLMESAKERLAPFVAKAPLVSSEIGFVMNVPGDYVDEAQQVRTNLVEQVTKPVRWEAGVRAMSARGTDLFIEVGAGRTLSGMNKRIGVPASTISVDKVEDLKQFEQVTT